MPEGGIVDDASFRAPISDDPSHRAELRERRRLLLRSLAQLDQRHIDLIQLRYGRELTFAEIAQLFGVGESAVHNMHGRILRWLFADLEQLGIRGLRDI